MNQRVSVDGDRVRVEITTSDENVVAYFAAIDQEEKRVEEARRILRLGTDTAGQVGVRAEMLALDHARRRIVEDTEAMRRQVAEVAAGTQDAWRRELERLRHDAAAELADAIVRATGNGRIKEAVAAVLVGEDSPLRTVERRLFDAARTMEASHQRGLDTAVTQMGDVATTLARLTGTLEANQISPARGRSYEESLENRLTAAVEARGDRLSDVRSVPAPDGSKRGDYLAVVDRSAIKVGIELKNTQLGPSAEGARELVDKICDARDCQAALLVAATPEAMPAGLRGATLGLIGDRGVAVCLPADGDQHLLEAAYALARSIAAIEDRRRNTGAASSDMEAVLAALANVRGNLVVLAASETHLKATARDVSAHAKRIGRRTKEALAELEKLVGELSKEPNTRLA